MQSPVGPEVWLTAASAGQDLKGRDSTFSCRVSAGNWLRSHES